MRFIRTKDVLRMLGVSRTTLWRMVRSGAFPRRVTISARARGHVLEEVEAWMAERADRSPARLDVLTTQVTHADDSAGLSTSVISATRSSGVDDAGPRHGSRRRRGQGRSS